MTVQSLPRLTSSLHVIAGLYADHGGPTYSVPRLCQALAEAGADVGLYSVLPKAGGAQPTSGLPYIDRRFPWDFARVPIVSRLRWSRQLGRELRKDSHSKGVMHNHGVWLLPNIQSAHAAGRAGVPLVIAPHGMLAPEALNFSANRKKLFWSLFQGKALRQAACIHATSEQEYEEIRALGLTNPVMVIPNGIDTLPYHRRVLAEARSERTVLSLGRLHPKKGLAWLINAWALVEKDHPNWRLRIVGPSELGHGAELLKLCANLGLKRAFIEEPIYGNAKVDLYGSSDIFVLPSLNENFGLTVGEALAAELPVITTKGTPWADLAIHKCGWWIDHGIESLTATLQEAMATSPHTLRAMGANGRKWMQRDFCWDPIARDMLDVYCWLANGGTPPQTVRLR